MYTLPNEFADANECPACVGMGYWLKFDNDNGEIKETKETCDRCLGNGLFRQKMRESDDDNK
jgi:DnaJ-class molecular chaperone